MRSPINRRCWWLNGDNGKFNESMVRYREVLVRKVVIEAKVSVCVLKIFDNYSFNQQQLTNVIVKVNCSWCWFNYDNGGSEYSSVRFGAVRGRPIAIEEYWRCGKWICVLKNSEFFTLISKNLQSGFSLKRNGRCFNRLDNDGDYSDSAVDSNGVGTDSIGLELIER